jgi:putative copper export protein
MTTAHYVAIAFVIGVLIFGYLWIARDERRLST